MRIASSRSMTFSKLFSPSAGRAPLPDGIEPRYAGKPRSRSTPNPREAAAEARAAWSTLACWEMNAVLHEFATAVVSGIWPRPEAG